MTKSLKALCENNPQRRKISLYCQAKISSRYQAGSRAPSPLPSDPCPNGVSKACSSRKLQSPSQEPHQSAGSLGVAPSFESSLNKSFETLKAPWTTDSVLTCENSVSTFLQEWLCDHREGRLEQLRQRGFCQLLPHRRHLTFTTCAGLHSPWYGHVIKFFQECEHLLLLNLSSQMKTVCICGMHYDIFKYVYIVEWLHYVNQQIYHITHLL